MNIRLIKEPKPRAELSANFLKRAVQSFADAQCHKDLTIKELLEVRRIPHAEHYMYHSQRRYVF